MTAEMRYFARLFGDVLFLDWKKSGVSDIDWPYQGPIVLDEDLCIHRVANVLACTESNESYKFALNSITSIEPALQKLTRVVFSDRLASESVFFDCLNLFRFYACAIGICGCRIWGRRLISILIRLKYLTTFSLKSKMLLCHPISWI